MPTMIPFEDGSAMQAIHKLKEYFNLSIKDTIRSWSLMETIVSLVGLAGVLLLNLVVR